MTKMKEKCPALLHPNQLGVALPGGAEIGVHTLRQYVNHNHSEDKLVAKIDFRNAFNSIRRDQLLTQVKEHTPSLYKMIYQCYSTQSYLYFGDKDLLYSKEGVQQGDPLGPLLFSLGIRDLMKSCKSEVNIWYLDDGTVCGDPKTVHEDLTRILEASNPLGLSVNSGKCEIFTRIIIIILPILKMQIFSSPGRPVGILNLPLEERLRRYREALRKLLQEFLSFFQFLGFVRLELVWIVR